jgi:hypothetical protein
LFLARTRCVFGAKIVDRSLIAQAITCYILLPDSPPHETTMTIRILIASIFVFCFSSLSPTPLPQSQSKDAAMPEHHVTGPFDVKLTPLGPAYGDEDSSLSRMSVDKQFHGDLEATSKGEMLAAATSVKGSAGYVAIEHVAGSLRGRTGAFILQHNATMNRGTPQLSIIVVPDSGTGQLRGLSGSMQIIVAPDGNHSYALSYTLPSS